MVMMAAGPATPSDHHQLPVPVSVQVPVPVQPFPISETFARDAIIAWFRGEFAAANAIIDALCNHLAQMDGSDYESVFAAIHRRRLNWIPVLQMQKYYSIADVTLELKRVAAEKMKVVDDDQKEEVGKKMKNLSEKSDGDSVEGTGEVVDAEKGIVVSGEESVKEMNDGERGGGLDASVEGSSSKDDHSDREVLAEEGKSVG